MKGWHHSGMKFAKSKHKINKNVYASGAGVGEWGMGMEEYKGL
jgi:hypothetical protein